MGIIDKNPFESKELSWIDKTSDVEIREVGSEQELIIVNNKGFDYSILDNDTADFLKEQEGIMHLTMSKAYTKLGEVLYKTQEILVGKGYRCFVEWAESLGFKKTKAYTLIDRYKLMLEFKNSERERLIENLPISLAYEISKKSADTELREMVLSGDIKTLKEYKEYRDLYKDKEDRKTKVEGDKREVILNLAELISKNRSYDEKTDYELACLIAENFKIDKK